MLTFIGKRLSFQANLIKGLAMMSLCRNFTLLLVFVTPHQAFAQSNYSYNARIQCGNSGSTNNEYFRAKNDTEAKNEVMRLLNNNTGYRGKGCRLIELTSDAPQNKKSSNSYEARVECAGSSGSKTEYFSADSDMAAENEVRRILNNNTGYKGKNCRVTELRSR
jgi:hypothetical protein